MKEKILIALSDQNLVKILSTRLAGEGYIMVIAKSGDEALQKMRSDNPALVLIDLVLPGKNGYDVLTEKTLDRMITKIPVIIISNSGATVEMKRIPATPNIREYIVRFHVDPEEVTQKVSAIFGRSDVVQQVKNDKPQVSKKILWVEDDKLLNQIIDKKFHAPKYILLKASSGDMALKMLETETPDLIVLDILLPGMNGFDILQKIKSNPRFRGIPSIILSNLNELSDIEKAKILGVKKFIVKATASLEEIMKEVDLLLKI